MMLIDTASDYRQTSPTMAAYIQSIIKIQQLEAYTAKQMIFPWCTVHLTLYEFQCATSFVIFKYFAAVMFCQGRSKLCSQGQENPFKLCLRDKIQNGIKPLLTNADVTPNKALGDNRAPALRCATQENSRLWGDGRLIAASGDWGCHISNEAW